MDNNELCDNVLGLLRKITRSIDQRSRGLIKKYGLTVPQLLILKEVVKAIEPITASEIANTISLSPATVTPIIEKLTSRGYLNKVKSDKDKRKIKLLATEKAHVICQNSPTLMHEQFVKSFSELRKWEQMMILAALEKISEMVDVPKDLKI